MGMVLISHLIIVVYHFWIDEIQSLSHNAPMDSAQLEFNFDNMSPKDLLLAQMQKQLDEACTSMGKVRRKMFAELGEFRRQVDLLLQENAKLKHQMMKMAGQKTDWAYWKDECLFMVCEPSESPEESLQAMA